VISVLTPNARNSLHSAGKKEPTQRSEKAAGETDPIAEDGLVSVRRPLNDLNPLTENAASQ